MDVRLLEAFRAVMETQSVTRAADILGLTQPAVSAQIARLEVQVGFALFDRRGGRLSATEDGRRFWEEVRNALGMIERLEGVAEAIRDRTSEAVAIACHPAASLSLMPGVVSDLLRSRPGARVRMVNRTSEEVRAIFEAGAADLAIAEWPIHLPDLRLRRYALPCVAVAPKESAVAGARIVTPKTLSGVPIVAMPESRLVGHRIRAVFLEAGLDWEPVAESEYFGTICGLVAAGCGAAVVDPLSAATFSGLGLCVRPFEPTIYYEVAAFRREGRASPLVDETLALIDRRLRPIAEGRRKEAG